MQYLNNPINFKEQLIEEAREEEVIRLHVDGEFLDESYFLMILNVVNECNNTVFFVYTKRYDLIEKYKDSIPNNLKVMLSIDEKNPFIDKVKSLYRNSNNNIKVFYSFNNENENENEKELYTVTCFGNCRYCDYCYNDSKEFIKCKIH